MSKAQTIADALEQLSLDYKKLAGMKSTLKQMYQGYETIVKGYHAVNAVSQGNFNLHKAYLDGLFIVSPAVRQYPRLADIASDQASIMAESKSAYHNFRQDKHFSAAQISYMQDVYSNLVSESLQNLSDLAMIMTDSKMRMSDADRLAAIDRIYSDSQQQLSFLRRFNNQAYQGALWRSADESDKKILKKMYGIHE